MPEGPTLHALASALNSAFAGRQVHARSPQGRFAAGAALLDGRRLLEASAWGKHVFAELEGDAWLHVHLGLIGSFRVTPRPEGPEPPVVGQVRLRLLTDEHVADLRGPNLCAVVSPEQVEAVTAGLGPDPLRPDPDRETAWRRISSRGRSIGELLMEQSVVAGIGNVYRCELLHRHRVDPFTPGLRLRPQTWRLMWEDLCELMAVGRAAGQILTMPDQVEEARAAMAAGEPVLPGERRYLVYRRAGEPCRVCRSRVRTQVVGGRNLFWCGNCQRRR